MVMGLNKKQEEQLLKFREECLAIGLSTEPIKREVSEHKKLIDFIYKEYLSLPSPVIFYIDSPLMFSLYINFVFKNFNRQNLWQNLEQNLGVNLEQNLGENLEQNLRQNLEQNLRQNLWQNLGENLWQNLGENLWQNLRQNLGENLEQNLGQNLGENLEQNLRQNLGQNLEQNLRQNLWQNLGENLEQNLRQNLRQNLEQNLRQNLWQNLRQNLEQNLRQNLRQNLGENLWQNLGENLEQNLRQNLRQNLGENLEQNLRQNLRQNLGEKLWLLGNIYWGNSDIFWLSFYLFPQKFLGIAYTDFQSLSLNVFDELVRKIGWIWYFKDICFISDKPVLINKKDMRLHSETGPALSFKDGYSLWCLNGINVPRWLVETKAEDIDPELAIKEKNVDVQREIIRKIGAERMLKKLNAKALDVYKDDKTGLSYTLYRMNIGNIDRKYLHFEHASMKGVFYTKPIPPECEKAMHGYAWTRKLLGREQLKNIDIATEAELVANLPGRVS